MEMTARQRREANLGYVLVSISVLFIICQSFKIIPDIYEVITCRFGDVREDGGCGSNSYVDVMIDLSHLFLAINSSVNVVIYAWRGEFRAIGYARQPVYLCRTFFYLLSQNPA